MPAYDANRPEQSGINFFDHAGRTINLFETEPLNAFDSIDGILLETEEPLEAYFWDEPHKVSPWNSYWTEAAKNGGGLRINDPVFKDFWVKYHGLHVNCWEEEVCYCEHNCGGTHTTKGRAVSDSAVTVKPAKEVTHCSTSTHENSWSNYENRKLEKGKAVRTKQDLTPPVPLIILTTPSRHEVFIR